jgi:hypothetical protein
MKKKPFLERLVEIYQKTHKEPDWEQFLKKKDKKEKKNETDTTKI